MARWASPLAAQWRSSGAAQGMGTAERMAANITRWPLVWPLGTVFVDGLSVDAVGDAV